ncbi:hypothetical protein GGR54DRAFT_581123 [Hypoxylon sp. NC1633]|nr:hypothetical protein GGR54DRAFT_581123 [Hypoxylon sp. NC1633]
MEERRAQNRELALADSQLLRTAFSQNNQYLYLELVACGGFGSAHRVRYTHATGESVDFLVKKAYGKHEAQAALRREQMHLVRLRGCMHIVQLVGIANNPLRQHGDLGEWVALEWLPNGTVYSFIHKARQAGLVRLPNRLLWRFFLCLVRSCCGMAWPSNRRDGQMEVESPKPGVLPLGLSHNDIHSGNVLLGDFIENDLDHQMSPILKLIDFGIATDTITEDIEASRLSNLAAVGKVMVMLMTLHTTVDQTPAVVSIFNQTWFTEANAIVPQTPGGPLPIPELDDWMVLLVAMCMAMDRSRIPTLESLFTDVHTAVVQRTAEHYGNSVDESDDTVFSICRRVMFNASIEDSAPVAPSMPFKYVLPEPSTEM